MTNYPRKRIEVDAPVEALYELAIREGNSKKPVYEMHKWWARRLGSVFRMLLLLATAPEDQTDEELWKRFYEGDNLSNIRVLDPFMGGGTSVVEAIKLNIKAAGVDIDPVAWFVTRQEVSPCRLNKLEEKYLELENSDVVRRIKDLYTTNLPIFDPAENENPCRETEVIYNFWVDLLTCPKCGHEFEAHTHFKLIADPNKPTKTVFCKTCHQTHIIATEEDNLTCLYCGEHTATEEGPVNNGYFTCPSCTYKGKMVDLVKPGTPFPQNWFSIQYVEPDSKTKNFKVPDHTDLSRFKKASELLKASAHFLPDRVIPLEGRSDPRPINFGYTFYHQLFNARQLLSLNWLYEWISRINDREIHDFFLLAFSDALASNNLFCSYAFGYDKLTPLFGLHAYRKITRSVENNVWGATFGRGSYSRCFRKVLDGKKYCDQPFESRYKKTNGELEKIFINSQIHAIPLYSSQEWYEQTGEEKKCLLLNQSSEALQPIKDLTIDLILSDPPYYNNLSYSELSDFYYAWIKPDIEASGAKWENQIAPIKEALFVEPGNVKLGSLDKFTKSLSLVFRECNRVLKDDGLFVFTFHHLDSIAWMALTMCLVSGGFYITNIFPVRSEGKSGFHSTEGTVKWDSVLVCRKAQTAAKNINSDEDVKLLALSLIEIGVKSAEVWKTRFERTKIDFKLPDFVSLTYSYIIKEITSIKCDINYKDLFLNVEQNINSIIPEDQRVFLDKRKARMKSNYQER